MILKFCNISAKIFGQERFRTTAHKRCCVFFDENLTDFSPNFLNMSVDIQGTVPDHGEAFVAAEVGCSRNGGHRLLSSVDQVRVNLGR
jgi:hypothetical protein